MYIIALYTYINVHTYNFTSVCINIAYINIIIYIYKYLNACVYISLFVKIFM